MRQWEKSIASWKACSANNGTEEMFSTMNRFIKLVPYRTSTGTNVPPFAMSVKPGPAHLDPFLFP